MAKGDIKLVFRPLPVHPADFELLGIYFNEWWYVDMGCSILGPLFETFSSV